MVSNPDNAHLQLENVACPLCAAREPRPVATGRDFEYATSDDEFTFNVCGRCGVMYLDPRPDISQLSRIYPQEYAPYHFDEQTLTLRIRRLLEDRKAKAFAGLLPAEGDILDAGCGGPVFLDSLRRVGRPGWRLWGNDISDEVLEDLRRHGFQTVGGRFEQIDLPAASFDAIILKQVIEHLDDPRAVLVQAQRLLRPRGLLILETPNAAAWDARLFSARYWGGYHFPRHWTIFTPQTLTRQGESIGLEVVHIAFMLSPSFWVQSVHHRLVDRGWPAWVYNRFTHRNALVYAMAASVDVLQKTFSGRTSNMRIVFRKPACDGDCT